MNVPKEIAERAEAYAHAIKIANEAYETVEAWLKENTEADAVFITDLFVTDTPSGTPQGDGEYCSQSAVGWSGDSFAGTYYHPIEGCKLYLGYHYEC